MKKPELIYAVLLGLLLPLVKLLEYKMLLKPQGIELYSGVLALIFIAAGIAIGLQLQKKQAMQESASQELEPELPLLLSHSNMGISRREMEVLTLIAEGLSNQEIADRLFVSLNTVKTHSSRLFDKLDVKRRMQAVQRAKQLGLLPVQDK